MHGMENLGGVGTKLNVWTLFGNLDFLNVIACAIVHWLIEVFDAYVVVVNIAMQGMENLVQSSKANQL